MTNRDMFHTLTHLKGNPKACVLTEPLWSIPFYLFMPYATIYMRALGVTQIQIGYIITLGMISQVIFSLLGGIITDKLGRKRATFIFDIISWGIPTLIWAVSQNYYYFAAAAVVNGVWRVTAISWTCLLVEDADESKLVQIFSWIHITGMLAAFVSPLTGLLINKFDLIPTIRGIYFFTFMSMMVKFFILNKYSSETKQGLIRMHETKKQAWEEMIKGYGQTIRHILSTGRTLFVVAVMVIISIVTTVNSNFWGVAVTERIGIDPSYIGLITAARSMVMIMFYLFVLPKVNVELFKRPLIIGFIILIISQGMLIAASPGSVMLVVVSVLFEGVSLSLINPLLDSLQVTMIEKNDRAKIVAVLYTVVILVTAPFGSLAGFLSSADQRLPFALNGILLIFGLILVLNNSARHENALTD